MSNPFVFGHAAAGVLAGLALGAVAVMTPIVTGSLAPASAQVLLADEFHPALEPFGFWQQSRRWGEVWVPFERSRGWRPYTYGRWVYTEEWGWYWASDPEEEDWGWITYHYGRWVFDRGLGWAWVPGDEWAPAWVNWRNGADYVGWAPLPPDDVIYDYDNDPLYWTFLPPRYLTEPRMRSYFVSAPQRTLLLRRTVIVNRSFGAGGPRRFGVNPGISPAFIAGATRRPVTAYRVLPRVLAGTQGVSGAVQVRAGDIRRGPPRGPGQGAPRPTGATAAVIQPTNVAIQPAANVAPPQPLGRDERGRLGTHPPRAAQGAPPAGGGPSPSVAPPPSQQPAVAPSAAPSAPASPSPQDRRDQRPDRRPGQSPPAGAQAPAVTPAPQAPSAAPAIQPAQPAPPPVTPRAGPAPGAGAPARSAEPPPVARPVRPPPPQAVTPAAPAAQPPSSRGGPAPGAGAPARSAEPPPVARPVRPTPPQTPPSAPPAPRPSAQPPPAAAAPAAKPAAPPPPPAAPAVKPAAKPAPAPAGKPAPTPVPGAPAPQ
jgi:hypothetical protein